MANFIPEFNKKFVCIVDQGSSSLAAIVASYIGNKNEYLPMFEFPEAFVPEINEESNEFDENYISKTLAKEFSIRVRNCLLSMGGCSYLILAGLSNNQKSYLHYLGEYNVVQIDSIDEIDLQLKNLVDKKKYLTCREDDIHYGLYNSLLTDSLLKIDNNAIDIKKITAESNGLIVIEKTQFVATILAINYAVSIGAFIEVIKKPNINKAEIKHLIEKWKTDKNEQCFNDLSASFYENIEHIKFEEFKFATFFTVGAPYSLILKNVIPFTYVNLYLNPDFFIFNNIWNEKRNSFHSAIVFSPLEFKSDEETVFVIERFKEKKYYVRELVGKEASVYNIDNHVKEFPYEVLHICSHGGEVDGYSLNEEFKDRDGISHVIEYDEVVSFAPKKGEDLIEVTTKYIWRKFDGLIWKSKELKNKNYPKYVFADMNTELGKKENKKRIKKENIEGSCAIKCSDFNYQAMFNSIAGCHANPFIFNNTCWSWMDISVSFLSVGARGYIGTLWGVDNDVAKKTAEQFYKEVFDRTILDALQTSLFHGTGTSSENIYVFWGLHFSTLREGRTYSESKMSVAKRLLSSFYRWNDHLKNVKSDKTKDLVNRLINWNHDQLKEHFFWEAMTMVTLKKRSG